MDKSCATTFGFAKACGKLRKSFLKDKISLLFEQKSLSALWTLLFQTPAPQIEENLLAQKIEKTVFENYISEYIRMLDYWDSPCDYLVDQLKLYEVENLKEVTAALCSQEEKCPELVNLSKYSKLHFEYWPNLAKITEGTDFSWLNQIPDIHKQALNELQIDNQFIKHQWNSIKKLSGDDRKYAEELFIDEYSLNNIIWALRLKIYYKMSNEQIMPRLFCVNNHPGSEDIICQKAINILSKDCSKYSDWENWKYSDFLNPKTESNQWKIDPTWIEKKFFVYKAKRAYHIFYEACSSQVALAAWFKIKWYELSCIRSAVETIRLKIDPKETLQIIGGNSWQEQQK